MRDGEPLASPNPLRQSSSREGVMAGVVEMYEVEPTSRDQARICRCHVDVVEVIEERI